MTIGASGLVTLTADWVTMGTWSPICKVAVRLSSTIRDGAERIFTSVMPATAERAARPSVPARRTEKPGNCEATAPLAASLKVVVNSPLWKNQVSPKDRLSVSVTSAIVASRKTWLAITSRRLMACSRRPSCSLVASTTRELLESSAMIRAGGLDGLEPPMMAGPVTAPSALSGPEELNIGWSPGRRLLPIWLSPDSISFRIAAISVAARFWIGTTNSRWPPWLPLRSSRSIHARPSAIYPACGVTMTTLLRRSSGMNRTTPESGPPLPAPRTVSRSDTSCEGEL